jgi:hypothetical protein
MSVAYGFPMRTDFARNVWAPSFTVEVDCDKLRGCSVNFFQFAEDLDVMVCPEQQQESDFLFIWNVIHFSLL